MEENKIIAKRDYKDIKTDTIMDKCIENKLNKSEIKAFYMTEDTKSSVLDEENNNITQYVNNAYCNKDNLSNLKFKLRILPFL